MSDVKKEQPKRQPGRKYALPFFVVLGLITVISFIIPLRPTRSNSEKRDLAKFPEFSVEAVLSGDYFEDVTLWFSDTFPGRERWISLATYSDSLHGSSDIMIEGELQITETVPVAVPPAPPAPMEVPDDNQPEQTDGADATEPVEETEPEEWGGVDAGDAAEILQSATAIQIGDAVFTAQGFSQQASDHYIDVINDFYNHVRETGVTVISAPAPTAVGILIEEEYLPKLNCVSQVDILNYLHGGMYEGIVKVDTASALLDHNDEYIYYRTDHHWTALGAYYSYAAVCEAIGMEPVDLSTLEVWSQGTFKGSLYGKASRPYKLTLDTVDAYIPVGDIVNYSISNDMISREIPVLSDTNGREENTKYLVFGTDYPMSHMENRSLPDAPNILVVKDSFGNCFVPFLSQNFHHVYAADYRKFRAMPLTDFIEKYDIDYVLFMPYVTATQSSDGYLMVRRLSLGNLS